MSHTRGFGAAFAIAACMAVAGCGGSSGKAVADSSTSTSTSASVAPTTATSTSTSAPTTKATAVTVPVGQTMKRDGYTLVVGKATDITHNMPSDASEPNGNSLFAVADGISVLKIPITVVNTGSSALDYLGFKVDGISNFGGSVVEDEGFGWGSEVDRLGGLPDTVRPGENVTQDYAYSVETGQSLKLRITPPTGAAASFTVSLGGGSTSPSSTTTSSSPSFGQSVMVGPGLRFTIGTPVRDPSKDGKITAYSGPAYRIRIVIVNESETSFDLSGVSVQAAGDDVEGQNDYIEYDTTLAINAKTLAPGQSFAYDEWFGAGSGKSVAASVSPSNQYDPSWPYPGSVIVRGTVQ